MAAWTSGNGVTNSRSFDQDYRVTDIEIAASGTLHDLSFGHNVVNNITSLTDQVNSALSQTFDYDDLDRLTDADGDYGDQAYTYDANGNRTERDNATTLVTQTLTYTTGTNRIASVDSQSVTHDGAGNRISDSGGTRTYAYNHAGRLIQFTESSMVQADYTYNAQGQRVEKVRHVGSSDFNQQFFYDQAGQLIAEHRDNPDGTYSHVDYVWLNDSPLVQEERLFNSSDVLTGTQTTWLHVDHLNTPRIGTDDSQTLVWRWDSDPFGVGEADTDPDLDSTDHVVVLRMPGQSVDEESGHFYNYFRDYDPSTGRYVQGDPIGLVGGVNRYTYVGGNPVILTDPTGEAAAGCAVGSAIGGPWGCAAGALINLAGAAAFEAILNEPSDPSEEASRDADSPKSCAVPSDPDFCGRQYEEERDDCEDRYGIFGSRGADVTRACKARALERFLLCNRFRGDMSAAPNRWSDADWEGYPTIHDTKARPTIGPRKRYVFD